MFVELHIIQNFPPSNLNRDDLGQPKDTEFGGYRRARISSQCLKRVIRGADADPEKRQRAVFTKFTKVPLSARTARIAGELAKRLAQSHGKSPDQAREVAKMFAEEYAGGMNQTRPDETSVLLFLSESEIAWVAEKLAQAWDTLVSAKQAETPIQALTTSFVQHLASRTAQPAKGDNTIALKDVQKELEQRLSGRVSPQKDVKPVASEFRKAFGALKSDAKIFTAVEMDWVGEQIVQQWPAIQSSRRADSPVKGIVDELTGLTTNHLSAPDIALFGRMLAGKPLQIDAACQVAHAISTHSIAGRTPIDYYTAMDDLKPKTDPGAGFLDVAYFNSACFYRYARLDYAQLKANLGTKDLQGNDLADLPLRTVEAFLRASEAAIPSGKKNAFAPECRPSFMLAVVRDSESAGWSLVNAFQKPVNVLNKGEEDLIVASVKRLEKQFKHLKDFYGNDTVKAIAVALPDGTVQLEDLGDDFRVNVKNMKGWVDAICGELRKGG
ncbi:MAG: type I-E CRISPR-associated protein Cas7/Cse4/CasC [Chloroflexi bacterium]|nr:type I-E CRISPR-associated protein Cas7/Cse4/CasC [Chloroflexota bacterium]